MIEIEFMRNTVRYRQLWGNESTELSAIDVRNIDILEFRESYVPLPGLSSFRNGVVDLSAGVTAAYEKFEKGFKYEVRRAEKDGFVCKEVSITEAILDAYYEFGNRKRISSISRYLIGIYQQQGVLFTSGVYLAEAALQYHLYFVMDREIILLASFPAPESHAVKKTAIGFANRYLHWFDLQHAVLIGKHFYDLGGIGNDADATHTEGIVKFKMEMAPDERNYYHGTIPVSLKGKFYTVLKKLLNKE
jgi:hypothetical protein